MCVRLSIMGRPPRLVASQNSLNCTVCPGWLCCRPWWWSSVNNLVLQDALDSCAVAEGGCGYALSCSCLTNNKVVASPILPYRPQSMHRSWGHCARCCSSPPPCTSWSSALAARCRLRSGRCACVHLQPGQLPGVQVAAWRPCACTSLFVFADNAWTLRGAPLCNLTLCLYPASSWPCHAWE